VSDGPFHLQTKKLSTKAPSKASSDAATKETEREKDSGIRKRSTKNSKDGSAQKEHGDEDEKRDEDNSQKDEGGPTSKESEDGGSSSGPAATDPLKMFGILVPGHLRNAQGSFRDSLHVIVELSNVVYQLQNE
jgi:hypothetical protein